MSSNDVKVTSWISPSVPQRRGAGLVAHGVRLVRPVLHGGGEGLGPLRRVGHRLRQRVAGGRGAADASRLPGPPLPAHRRPVAQAAAQPGGGPAERPAARPIAGGAAAPPAGAARRRPGGPVAAELLLRLLLRAAGR